jgi:hypothetical protein
VTARPIAAFSGRRIFGASLIGLGLTGLVLFGGIASELLRSSAGTTLDLKGTMARVEQTLDDAALTARAADEALGSTGASSQRLADLLDELATTLRTASGALRIDILGSQPFAQVADEFALTADRATAAAAEVATTTGGIERTRVALAALATDLASLTEEADRLAGAADGIAALSTWRGPLVFVAIWFAGLSVVLAVGGARLAGR